MISKIAKCLLKNQKTSKNSKGIAPLAIRRFLHSVEYGNFPKVKPVKDNPDRKYIFFGVGSIGKPTAAMLNEFVDVNYKNVILIDQIDMTSEPCLQPLFKKGARFLHRRLENDDYAPLFEELDMKPYDVLVDLSTNTNCFRLVEELRKKSLMYINTSTEIDWHFTTEDVYESSLLYRYEKINDMYKLNPDPKRPTNIQSFGMNPGLISHLSFQGLLDVASLVLKHKKDDLLSDYVANKQFNLIAKHLQLNTIHVAEVDTQISKNYKNDGTFVNTWSVNGLIEEGVEPAQSGWGTHEKTIPNNGVIIGRGAIAIKGNAISTLHRSYVPDQEYVGMCIPHMEAVTLNKALTAENYSPTVHYVYKLPQQTLKLLENMKTEDLVNVKNWRVFNPLQDDLVGEDICGSLLIFAKNPITGEDKPWTYWFGSVLGQGTSEFFGPTSIQVTSAVLTSIKYMVENNSKGNLWAEDLPNDYVMRHTLPYLGKVLSIEGKWRPKSTQFVSMSLNECSIS